jgi:N12 class adenine-specific DNA methylase/intein/homing endonuclease
MNLKLLKLLDKTPKPTFRIKSTTGDLVEIKDFTKVDLGVSATFYVHKSIKGDSYVVSEAHTGLKIENGANEGIAIGKARHKVSEYVKKNSEEAFLNIIRTEFKKIYPNIPFPEDKPVQPVKIAEPIKVEEPKQLDIEQAFTNALDYTNFVDLAYMSNELGISEEEISAELLERKLVFVNPGTNSLETNDEYLSGNVTEKLRIAEKALETNGSYERNVEALKAVIPDPIPSALIQYSLGAAWIPKEIFEAFALSIFKQKVKVEYISATGKFSARGLNPFKTPQVLTTYSGGGKNGIEIFNATLNNQQIIVSEKGVKKINETAEAQSMQEQMQEEFQQWIRVNKEIEQETEVIYNELLNSHVARKIRVPTIEYYPNASRKKKPMIHQKLAVSRSLNEATGIAHFAGAGKAQPLNSILITPTGAKTMGEIRVGDLVISDDGKPTKVIGVYPQGVKEIFKVIFSDGTHTECCEEHLWLTYNAPQREGARAQPEGKIWDFAKPTVKTLKEIKSTLIFHKYKSSGAKKNHSIPIVKPIEFEHQDNFIHPYLMGALLGDGCLRTNSALSFVSVDEHILNRIRELLPVECSLKKKKTDKNIDYQISRVRGENCPNTNPVIDELRILGAMGKYSYEKSIPKQYIFNSVECRIEMLRGLMDTDGTVGKRGTSSIFYSTSKQLADDVTFLVNTLGGTTNVIEKKPYFTHKGIRKQGRICYIVTIKLPAEINPFSLPRKRDLVKGKTKYKPVRYIVGVEPIGLKEAQCISVDSPSRLYLTDNCIVTHNTITASTTTMELRRLGYAKKPMIVVQKKTLGDFVQEFIDLYPTANLLIANDSELTVQGRPYFYQRIRDEDFDAVIMPHSQFELIPDNIERQRKNLGEQLAVAYDIMEKTNKQVSPLEYAQAKRVVKSIQKELDDIDIAEEIRIEVQNKAYEMYGTPPLLDFEQMGIDALLIDECFPYETPILTTKGMFPIGYIVDNKIETEVLSYNKETDTYEPKKIVRWLPKPLTQKLVKVTHSRGSFVCTENHKIFTDIGYVEAKNLTNERSITYADLPMVQSEESKQKGEQFLQSGMLEGKQKIQHNEGLSYVHTMQEETSEYDDCEILQQGLSTRSSKTSEKNVFTLQNKRNTLVKKHIESKILFSKMQQGRAIINAEHNILFGKRKGQNTITEVRLVQDGNSEKKTAKILRTSMCSVLPKFIRRSKGEAKGMCQEIYIKEQYWQKVSRSVFTNEVKQSIKKSRSSSENKCSEKRENIFVKRREWSANKASNNATRSIRCTKGVDGMGYKNNRSKIPIQISSVLLQSRHWYSSSENFYRSGREITSFEEMEVFRPQENGNIECVRVESCEVYERGDRCEFTFGSGEGETVYDIEVEDNHNYFAAGVLVSNCHQYKRLGLQTSLTNVKGIDTTKSKRAQSCLLKVRWVQEIKNGKNVVFYTGTPISNTMAEAWTMIKFIRPDILKEIGIEHFDQFAKTFGQIVPSLEQTGGGTFKIQNRFAKFQNLPEFIAAFLRSWDVVSPEDVPEFIENNTLPKLIGGKIEQVIVKRSDELVEQIAEFRKELEWYEGLEGIQKRQYNYIPLVIYNRAKQASIDLRLLNPTNNDNPMSKVNQMIRSAIDKYRTHGKPQMVFCDLYQSPEPKHEFMDEDCTIPNTAYGKPRFNLFNDIKAKLIKLGVKPNEIAILTEPKYDKMDKVKELFDLANKGIVKFLLGTTQKLGIGVNAQRKLYWLHHLDAPQRPMDFSQRNARIIRQGNLNPEVGITAYGTEKTLDSAAFQRLSIKQFFINQVLKGQTTERVTEDAADEAQMTFDEMMAHLSDSPYAMQKLLVDNKLKSERMKLDNFNAKQFQTQRQLNYLSDDLVKMRLDYQQQLKYSKVASENFTDGAITELRIGDKVFTEHLGIEADGYVEMLINLYFGSPTKSAKGSFLLNGIKVMLEVNNTDEWSKKTKQMVDKPILSYTMPEIGLFPSFYGNGISVHSNSGTGLITSARYKVHDAIHAPVDTKKKIERYELNAEELTRTLDNVFDYTKMETLEAEIEVLKEKMLNEKNVGVEI